jgi:hypothetical protein
MSRRGVSAAMTRSRMAGGQCVRRHRHATERDRGRQSNAPE